MIIYKTATVNNDGNNYPDTKAVNSSGPTTQDGTEYTKPLIDDEWGANQALLNYTGDTPDGSAELAAASQRMDSLKKIVSHIDTVNATGTYTIEEWNKKGVLVCQPGTGTITLAAGTGTNQTNRILIYNQSGGSILLTRGVGLTEAIPDDKLIEYVYDGTTNFQRTAPDAVTPNGYKAGLNIQLNGSNLEIKPGIMQYFDSNGVSKLKEISIDTAVTNESTVTDSFIYFVYYDESTDQFKVDNSIRTVIPVGAANIQTAWTDIVNAGDTNVNFDAVKNYYETGTGYRIIAVVEKAVGTWDMTKYINFWNGTNCQGHNQIGGFDRVDGNQKIERYDFNTLLMTSSSTGQTYVSNYIALAYIYPIKWVAPSIQNDLAASVNWVRASEWAWAGAIDGPASLTQLTAFAFSETATATGRFIIKVSGPFIF